MTRILYDLAGANDLRFSPNCWRSRMALAHKGLAVDCEPCRFTEKDKIAFSGQPRVPVLRDDDTVVTDSWDIACYLEEIYPDAPSLFGGPIGRGLSRQLNCWTNEVLHPALVKTILIDIYDSIDPADKTYFRETREIRFGKTLEAVAAERDGHFAALRHVLGSLNTLLGEQAWICGEGPAYGDYLIFGACQWARAVSALTIIAPDEPLYDWRDRMLDRYDGLGRSVPAKAAA